MPNPLKLLMQNEIQERYPKGSNFLIVGHEKLSGPETAALRRALRERKVCMEVVKNTVAARALEANGLGAANTFLRGPCALVAGDIEITELCKLVVEQSKKLENRLFVRGGVMAGAALTPAQVAELATIPPIQVLRAQLLAGIQSPLVRTGGMLQSLLRSVACALEGLRKLKESQGPSAPPPPAASGPAPSAAA